VSIDHHKHSMIGMMVLRKGYALVFGPSNARKPCEHVSDRYNSWFLVIAGFVKGNGVP